MTGCDTIAVGTWALMANVLGDAKAGGSLEAEPAVLIP